MTYPGPGQYPYDPTTVALAQAGKRSRRRLTIILSAVVAVLVVVVALVANQVYFERTGKAVIPALTLRSANDPGPDPFTAPVHLTNKTRPVQPRVDTASGNGVRLVNGTAPGLYGTYGGAVCDTAALGNQLAANPGAASAWAAVQGIRTQDIPWYLNSLTPVVLTADTWVTNYSYTGGVARPFQAVLESGTAVFVDADGVPRAVCACGNPLRPPADAPIGGYRVTGTRWPGYTVNNTYRVTYNNTYVSNSTVISQAPQPRQTAAANPVLDVIDLVTRAIVPVVLDGELNDLGPAPAGMEDFQSPEFLAARSGAPTFDDQQDALAQGLAGAGETRAAENVEAAAAENGGDPLREETAGEQSAADGAPGAADSSAADSSAADASAADRSGSSQPRQSTVFASLTAGSDAIGELTYRDGTRTVTCRLPSTFDGATVTPVNSDCPLVFNAGDLRKDAVDAAVAGDADRVWTLTPIGATSPVEVLSATWQTLTPESTTEEPTTTTTTETTETTEETVEEPTTTTTTTTEEPSSVETEESPAVPSA
ncbi:DUF6777 domain-containing protein [Gordonia sp. VNK21]|uniref:DUF6777 domain-containing protein n=1 Tax=Gordonia sp. VNK21 TaxID=3382483 RepID=UPI0038D3B596